MNSVYRFWWREIFEITFSCTKKRIAKLKFLDLYYFQNSKGCLLEKVISATADFTVIACLNPIYGSGYSFPSTYN